MSTQRLITADALGYARVYPDPEYFPSTIDVDGQTVLRVLVHTHLIRPGESICDMMRWYFDKKVQPGDIVFIGQKVAAIAEGRCIPLAHVHPSKIARLLALSIRRTPHGLGLRRPETMEMAIREVGLSRILLAAAAGLCDRLTGRSGDFYRIVGPRVSSIDGPGPNTIPPFDTYVVLTPRHPDRVCRIIRAALGVHAVIVDANDLGCEILGTSTTAPLGWVKKALRDNPMGQGTASTPIGLVRRLSPPAHHT